MKRVKNGIEPLKQTSHHVETLIRRNLYPLTESDTDPDPESESENEEKLEIQEERKNGKLFLWTEANILEKKKNLKVLLGMALKW